MRDPRWKIGALLSAVAMLAAACGGGGGDDAGGDAAGEAPTGTITVWARDSQQVFMSKLVDLYNKSHEVQAKVTVIPAESFVQKLGTAASSDSGPDVASIDLVYAPYFASAGALEDISELADALPYKDALSPSHRRLSTWEDTTYALPFTAEASAMYYNKELFEKAGLDPDKPPANYAELREAAKKIRGLGKDYYGFTFAGACGGCNVFEFTPAHLGQRRGGALRGRKGGVARLAAGHRSPAALPRHVDRRFHPERGQERRRHAADPALHQRQGRHDTARCLRHPLHGGGQDRLRRLPHPGQGR